MIAYTFFILNLSNATNATPQNCKINYMKSRILISLLALITWTACFAQPVVDSVTHLAPLEMDYFLQQDARAYIYAKQLNDCRADNVNLQNGIKEKDAQLVQKDTIISTGAKQFKLKEAELAIEKNNTKVLYKIITRLRVGLYSTLGALVTYTSYMVFKPPK